MIMIAAVMIVIMNADMTELIRRTKRFRLRHLLYKRGTIPS